MRYQSQTKLRNKEKKIKPKKNFNIKGYSVPLTYLNKKKNEICSTSSDNFYHPFEYNQNNTLQYHLQTPYYNIILIYNIRLKFLSQSPAFYRNSSVIYCVMKPHPQIASLAKISQSRQKSNHVKEEEKNEDLLLIGYSQFMNIYEKWRTKKKIFNTFFIYIR